ncbi:MAG: amino acid permease [Gemmataceae bacterium]|nr:amino acid permease [Gemmataceae bacterium]
MGDDPKPADLDAVVDELVAEAHVRADELRTDERDFLKEHALKKPLRVPDIWALGVGGVIAGAYFGWNLGLKGNGAVAMLIASLIVCLLYLTWVLALAELSVAMPFAGGPLAYGRRAFGPTLGFVMGWSMFLECQFATIATALATGGYVAFLIDPADPNPVVSVGVSLLTVFVFFVLQAWGVKEQSRAMMLMTYAAILGLVIFWLAAATNFSWDRIGTRPLLPAGAGWMAVLKAVPYALWWLVIIETVALAAEEAHEPHRTIPRGLVWAQLTLIGLVVLTWLFACGALSSEELAVTLVKDANGAIAEKPVDYPLLKVIGSIPVGRSPLLFYGFGGIALFGMIASFHGMVFGTSRQGFALGRAGYLPGFLGAVHATRRTPVPALLATSLITGGFVVASIWFREAIDVAVLMSTLTALIWYILAMGCLFVLRRREPQLFEKYRTPLHRVLPVTVIVLSLFAVYMYGVINVDVILPTAGLYAVGLAYFWLVACNRLQGAAPEELAARHGTAASPEVPS